MTVRVGQPDFLRPKTRLAHVSMGRMGRARGFQGAVICGLFLASTLIGAAAPQTGAATGPKAVVAGHVLVYGPSVDFGSPRNEATIARRLGYTVAVADSIAWRALTRADFAKYDAVVIGDRGCVGGSRYLKVAAATRARWTPALTGKVSVVGTDPVYHWRFGGKAAAARRLIVNGLTLATASKGTGAYISLGCAYASAGRFTDVPLLAGFGPFTVRGQGRPPLGGCPNRVKIVRPSSPLVAGLTDAGLSSWGCSIHAGIDAYPYPFKVVAQHKPSKMPYMVTRRAGTFPVAKSATVYGSSATVPPDSAESSGGSRVKPNG
jgi:hypothetical protein